MASTTENMNVTQADLMQIPAQAGLPSDVVMPVGKLDADFYNAADLDGVTESLFGSGNLNYMNLQSRQNDFLASGEDGFDAAAVLDTAAAAQDAVAAARILSGLEGSGGGGADYGLSFNVADGQGGAFVAPLPSSFTGGGLSAAATDGLFARDTAAVDSFIDQTTSRGLNGDDGLNGEDGGGIGDEITNIVNNLTNITNITIVNPPLGGDDVDLFVHNDLGLDQIDANLDAVEDIVGDIDVGVVFSHEADDVTLDVDTVLAGIPLTDMAIPVSPPIDVPLADTVLQNLPNPDALLADPAGTVTELADALLADGVAEIQDVLQDPVGTVMDTVESAMDVENVVQGVTDLATSILDGVIVSDSLLGTLGGPLDADGALGTLTEPVTDLLGGLPLLGGAVDTGIVDDVSGLLSGLAGSPDPSDPAALLGDLPVVGDLLGNELTGGVTDMLSLDLSNPSDLVGGLPGLLLGDGTGTDTDLVETNNLGLPGLDVNLDLVESLVGDIDINLGATQGADDLTAGADALLLGMQVVDTEVPVPVDAAAIMDTVSGISGDAAALTEAMDAAANLLSLADTGGLTDGLTGDLLAGTDIESWPQAASGDLAGIDSLIGGIVDGAGLLPEPVGTVSEGLGILDTSDIGGGVLSGLGGGSLGGLFG